MADPFPFVDAGILYGYAPGRAPTSDCNLYWNEFADDTLQIPTWRWDMESPTGGSRRMDQAVAAARKAATTTMAARTAATVAAAVAATEMGQALPNARKRRMAIRELQQQAQPLWRRLAQFIPEDCRITRSVSRLRLQTLKLLLLSWSTGLPHLPVRVQPWRECRVGPRPEKHRAGREIAFDDAASSEGEEEEEEEEQRETEGRTRIV